MSELRDGGKVEELSEQLAKRDRQYAELKNEAEDGPPLPPPGKVGMVTGGQSPSGYMESGELAAKRMRGMLESNGLAMKDFGAVLDFGCGVGRIIRYWHDLEGPELHGTDYNPDLTAWCQENLTFADFKTNDLVGKLDYEDESFDFIYLWSVFTHLTEEQQRFWMDKYARILKPGGHLFFTTTGEFFVENAHALPPEQMEELRKGNLVLIRSEETGANSCAAFHPQSYVRDDLSAKGGFSILDFTPSSNEGPGTIQDAYLPRKS